MPTLLPAPTDLHGRPVDWGDSVRHVDLDLGVGEVCTPVQAYAPGGAPILGHVAVKWHGEARAWPMPASDLVVVGCRHRIAADKYCCKCEEEERST